MWRLPYAGLFAAAVYALITHNATAAETTDLTIRNPSETPWTARGYEEEVAPECYETCLNQTLPQACTKNEDCFCEDSKTIAAFQNCITTACELPGYLAAERLYSWSCDLPPRSKGAFTRTLCWSMFTIATVVVGGRFLGRLRALGGSGYGWDDWLALIAYALLVPTDVTSELEVQNGLGMDMWVLEQEQVVLLLKAYFFGEVMYSSIIMATKISLVLLYLRIWPADSVSRNFRSTCWVLVAALTGFLIAGTVASALQCTPISYAWLQVTGEVEGTCLNLMVLVYAHGILNVCFDVVVILLPVRVLLGMRLPNTKKAGLCAVFLVGFLVTICSIIRLQYVSLVDGSKNQTWDLQPLGVWSLVEVNFSVVVCCMPALTGLIQRTWKKLFGTPPQMGYSMVSGDDAFSMRSLPPTCNQPSADPEMVLEQWEQDAQRNREALAGM